MVAYESFKVKEKSSWVIPKVVNVAYGSLSRSSNGVGRLRERSQGKLPFYFIFPVCKLLTRDQVFVLATEYWRS